MQVPKRRYDKVAPKADPRMTEERFLELQKKLERLLKVARPRAIREVSRLAELGDFSENAEYQIAKGKLRGINARINEYEHLFRQVEIIKTPVNKDNVQIGHKVTVETDGKIRVYTILGSSESDPFLGIISRNAPLGVALLGKGVGEIVSVVTPIKKVEYKIINIE
ncbi:transcription elongation factor GreA [Candidatus Falkowbacteria bacterium CG10_big_fil_rev_8_21_14_0_10_37_14]|uniref:Transcription elongation factor GreA n=1 Tax=Candidatus Falkowbacteria bacterium CG10_big_fil_rev_8_21_14_0_10_37_14 TaxID=1974561 RepID=A0A2M6WU18_9BACT|nr:transcription elongation factor GreA [Candidatus Falkowbacteria bacterium]PIT96277.1 MAG: transcription elongation factor GreA [Candidatus Falkowbacteria bacterium CG10_big_fil_rev_8_21_14_0_10_37_14]